MDLSARFLDYASDFERSYADRQWSRLAAYFAADAVYECHAAVPLGFRVVGRDAILERFAMVTESFDCKFDARSIRFDAPRAGGARVSISGEVVYTLRDTPPLRLPFTEIAEYRGGEIIRLEDGTSPADVQGLSEWMARYGATLLS